MNRRNFVRLLGQATACTIVAPYVPDVLTSVSAFPPKPQIDFDLREVTTSLKVAGYVRVSKEMMSDLPFLTAFLRDEGLRLSGNDPDWESKTDIQIGDDGFIQNAKTIVLTYKKPEDS